jgi:hypothetical protein
MEECAEVQQAISKGLRFGFETDRPGNPGTSNLMNIAREAVDVIAVLELLKEEGYLDLGYTGSGSDMDVKKAKVLYYMEMLGRLTED